MFSVKDKENLVELLNTVALKAEFKDMKIKDMISFVKLLNWAQTDLLVKIDNHLLEITKVVQPKKEKAPK